MHRYTSLQVIIEHMHFLSSLVCTFMPFLQCAGTEAIIPVDESREAILGEMTQLGVHATAIPPLESGEIVWSRSDGSPVDVSNGSRFSLSNNMQLLTIDSVRIEDSDVYQIEIVRDGESKQSASINFNVHGKLLQSQQIITVPEKFLDPLESAVYNGIW